MAEAGGVTMLPFMPTTDRGPRMNTARRGLRRAAALTVLSAAALLSALAPSGASAAYQWADGVSHATQVQCIDGTGGSPIYQATTTYTGFYVDTNNLPKVGDVYYVHWVTGGVMPTGCPGGYAVPEIVPPEGSELAISAQTPVVCYAIDFTASSAQRADSNCPQTASQGAHGYRFKIQNVPNISSWPIPRGKGWEIQVPLRATRRVPAATGKVWAPTWFIGTFSRRGRVRDARDPLPERRLDPDRAARLPHQGRRPHQVRGRQVLHRHRHDHRLRDHLRAARPCRRPARLPRRAGLERPRARHDLPLAHALRPRGRLADGRRRPQLHGARRPADRPGDPAHAGRRNNGSDRRHGPDGWHRPHGRLGPDRTSAIDRRVTLKP